MRSFLLSLIACMLLSYTTQAQTIHMDSTTFTFGSTDSLVHMGLTHAYLASDTSSRLIIDTTGAHLWQIGHTVKSVFAADSTGANGIMTDTTNPYPANANDWFVLKMLIPPSNPVIELWHEYQTHSGHAGGTIEFSTDSLTWLNIISCGNILTQNIYSGTDTLSTGDPAFMGTSNSQQFSSFQFINCMGERTTQTNCFFINQNLNFYIRFRFISDSLTDSLAGWKIDSIRIIAADCSGGVAQVKKVNVLNVFPNPAFDGVFNFPALDDAASYILNIYDSRGNRVVTTPYISRVNLGVYPAGLYFYSVSNGTSYYSGKLQTE